MDDEEDEYGYWIRLQEEFDDKVIEALNRAAGELSPEEALFLYFDNKKVK